MHKVTLGNNFNKFFLINLKKFAISFLSFIFPSRLIATFFGIGYLPDWQSHWTAFFSIPLVCIVVHFTVGFGSSVLNTAQDPVHQVQNTNK